MRFLRSSGLPVPEVYDYSPSSDNAAKTEYIFMEFMRGTKLSDMWLKLEEPDIVSVLRQLAQLESRMMSIPFPAGGSLYYTNDLEKVAGKTGRDGVHGPLSTSSCDLLPYHICSLASRPTQKHSSLSGMPVFPVTFSKSLA